MSSSNILKKRKKVIIIHRIIAPYRVPFYEKLKETLLMKGVELVVVYGYPREHETDPYADVDFGIKVRTKYFYFNNRFVVWLSALKYAVSCDLIIVQQANTNLLNYLLIPLRKILGFKLAFWGHGKNYQAADSNSLGEKFKRIYSTHVDHWFAYTDLSKKAVIDLGFPAQRITSVNNAIDTSVERRVIEEIPVSEINELKAKYRIAENDPVGIFCSRIYKDKRMDFLIRCVYQVKKEIGNFHFFVIGDGDGEDVGSLRDYAANNNSWFHWVGPQFGRDKIKFFRLAQFQLMPGLVGLHIVDSFVTLTPLITTDIEYHSPEIIYVENGINGIITENSEEAYVSAIVSLINYPPYLDKLIKGCMIARETYTIESMVNRFANGIYQALGIKEQSCAS